MTVVSETLSEKDYKKLYECLDGAAVHTTYQSQGKNAAFKKELRQILDISQD